MRLALAINRVRLNPLHKYLYAYANPVMYNDPSGMFSDDGGLFGDGQGGFAMFDVMKEAVRSMDWAGADAFELATMHQSSVLSQFGAVEAAVRNGFSQVMGATQFAFAFSGFLQDYASIGDPLQLMLGFIGARACFAAGTKVITEIGPNGETTSRSIEDLRVGDFVVSRSELDPCAALERRRVLSRIVTRSDHLRILELQAANGTSETIRTTDGHPFWVIGAGWKRAGDLKVGERIAGLKDDVLIVVRSSREEHPEQITVYNFEIEGSHTYFVDDGEGAPIAVWAHNACLANSGETIFTRRGRQVHELFFDMMEKMGYTVRTAVKGIIPDAFQIIYDKTGKAVGAIITELKPDNSRAVARGLSQLERYAEVIAEEYGIAMENIRTVIQTYR